MRKQKVEDFWKQELEFIKRVNPCKPGSTFNHDPACFRRYVQMQNRFAYVDGFKDLADQILNHLEAKI